MKSRCRGPAPVLAFATLPALVVSFALPSPALARDYDVAVLVPEVAALEALRDGGELGADEVELLERLLDHPLDLNLGSRAELADLPGVTDALAGAIVGARAERGAFTRMEQLLAIPGLEREVYDGLVPFATLAPLAPEAVEPEPSTEGSTGVVWRSSARSPQAFVRARTVRQEGEAGALVALRDVADARWDRARGRVVSAGPHERAQLEAAWAAFDLGWLAVTLGSFDAAFGEHVTLATTPAHSARPVSPGALAVTEAGDARVRTAGGLLGVALTARAALPGDAALELTLLGSYRRLEAYQYGGLGWGYDDSTPATCHTSGECKDGYSCDPVLRICRTSRVADSAAPAGDDLGLRYLTLRNAVGESLVGADVSLALDPETQVGLVACRGEARVLVAPEAHPGFGTSSRYPPGGELGAVGVHARTRAGDTLLAGELALAVSGGQAVVARLVTGARPGGELTVALRWLDARFDHPLARPEAEPDLADGLEGRNELGARVAAVLGPWGPVHVGADLDVWRPTQAAGVADTGGRAWPWRRDAVWSFRTGQRVTLRLGELDRLTLASRVSGAGTSPTAPTTEAGSGVAMPDRLLASASLETRRVPRTEALVALSGTVEREDPSVRKEGHVRGRVSTRIGDVTRLVGAFSAGTTGAAEVWLGVQHDDGTFVGRLDVGAVRAAASGAWSVGLRLELRLIL